MKSINEKSSDSEFMVKVALVAIKEKKTIAEISSKFEVHRTQITNRSKM
jgi:putative transposase